MATVIAFARQDFTLKEWKRTRYKSETSPASSKCNLCRYYDDFHGNLSPRRGNLSPTPSPPMEEYPTVLSPGTSVFRCRNAVTRLVARPYRLPSA